MIPPIPSQPAGALPLIKLDHVAVTLNGRRILQDLHWRLMPGQHWAVLGLNGAGKTTFLSLVRGDLWPDQGSGGAREYGFNGKPGTSPIGLRKRMGMVSDEIQQRYLRFGWDLRGEEVVATGFFDTPMLYQPLNADQKRRLDTLFRLQGLGELRARRFLSLSQGEARKVLLARAMASLDLSGGPCLLVLDEVCEGLDATTRQAVLALMDTLARDHAGLQLLVTAHRPEDVPGCVNHALVVEHGRIVYQGARPRGMHRLLPAAKDEKRTEILPPALGHAAEVASQSASQTPLFELWGCDVFRGRVKVLKNLNWRMLPGENWAIVGLNGAGKSTFVELLYGSRHPALGGVAERLGILDSAPESGDTAPSALPLDQARSRMGLVSPALQAAFLAREGTPLTGEECVLSGFFGHIGLYAQPSAEQRELAARWMAVLGIADLAPFQVERLSFGQLRRLLLARAMVASPRVLLLDEPCSGLDSGSRNRMLGLLSRLAAQGTALVCATHREDELVPEINHVLRLESGRIVHAGPRTPGGGA